MTNEFGKFLKEHRDKVGLSLQGVADILHVKKPYVWDIEKGNNNPPQNYERLNKLAEALTLTKEERTKLFDLATKDDDIPMDVKQILKNNRQLMEQIRNAKGEKQNG